MVFQLQEKILGRNLKHSKEDAQDEPRRRNVSDTFNASRLSKLEHVVP